MSLLDGFLRPRFSLPRVLVGAALVLFERRRALLHAITLPLSVHVTNTLVAILAPEVAGSVLVGMALLSIALYVVMAVNIHRLVLVGEHAVPRFGIDTGGWPDWRRLLRYLGWWWLQWLLASFAFLTLAPLAQLGQAGLVVAVLGAAWVAGRVSLMLPGIAVDRPLDPRRAWARGERAGLRLAFIVAGLPALAALVLWPMSTSPLAPVQLLATVFSILVTAWVVAAASLAWQALASAPDGSSAGGRGHALRIAPDASRGILVVHLPSRPGDADPDSDGAGDGLHAYQGRLRGLVLEMDAAWDREEGSRDFSDLEAVLSRLAPLRVHAAHLGRVALVGPQTWSGCAPDLARLFDRAESRFFPPARLARARAWAAREED